MKKRQNLVLGFCVMAMALFSGCKQNIIIHEGKAEIGRPVPPVRTMRVVELTRSHHDVLKLFVMGEGATDSERQLAAKLVAQVKGGVAPQRADVRTDMNSADLVLRVRPHLTTVDHDGNYWRLNCEVLAEMQTRNAESIVAGKSFKYVMDKRVLGLEAAMSPIAEKGGKDVSNWCSSHLAEAFGREVGIALLSIELPPPPKGMQRNPVNDNRAILSIGEELRGMPGLLSYELTGKDEGLGICTYRLVYFRKSFPNGIATHVSAAVNKPVMYK